MNEVSSFWSRRRAAVQAEQEAEIAAVARAQEETEAQALAERCDAEVLAEMGLPDPAAMQMGDDFATFMSRKVPEHLRRQALRSLWRSNPVLACVDGLNDYDEDFRAAAMMQEPIKTAYQVGKGMLKHIEEVERQAQAALEQVTEVMVEMEDDAAPVAETFSTPATPEVETAAVAPEPEISAPTPRRMRFRFEGATT